MEFEDNKSNVDDQNIEEILQDIVLTEESNNFCFVKKDNTIFVVDCCPQVMNPLPGQTQSQFYKIMQSYKNFMMSKVIANCNDRVGLIFYNVNKKENSLNFDNICTVHQLQTPSAKMIKSVDKIQKDFLLNYGHSDQQVSLHQVLWLFGQQIKQCQSYKNHVRMFLFTPDDCPHTEMDEKRQQAINHARQLAAKGAHIELFPIRSHNNTKFDLRKFYQEIISFDAQDLNLTQLDNSSKILDLQTRIRQKQFKKRMLNRLLMQIGEDSFVGLQIFAMLSKSRKPLCKRLQSYSNKPLKRVIKRLNVHGQVLYNQQIGTYYPLGDERIILTKQDINKIKGIKKPGITLIGFKPKKLIKPYHNLRPSYFLYPDEQHVNGSSQFIDALIEELIETQQVGIVSILPRMNQQLRFAALFPQRQTYDEQDHHQTPPGFHMIILPYSDDIVNFAGGEKTIVKPTKVSLQLVKLTKLLINNLTVREFDFRNFENPSLQKFYSHLQAHALNESVVEQKEDTIQPDYEGFQKYSDIFKMVEQTADAQVQEQLPEPIKKTKRSKKEEKKEQYKVDENEMEEEKKQRKPSSKSKQKKEDKDDLVDQVIEKKSKISKKDTKKDVKQEDMTGLINKVQNNIEDGNLQALSKEEMVEYLKIKKLSCVGNKAQLADKIMLYISFSL